MIEQVVIRNWRAFDHVEIGLRPGLNLLVGPNGAGKTSVLEAVAFALGGAPATLSDVRLMARCPRQTVEVSVTLALDGARWEIVRGLSAAQRRTGDVLWRDGRSVAEGSEPVAAALEELLGVPGELFLRLLYMPEGDVYRFLTDPPLAALEGHLRRVLGLEQLALVDQAAARVKREVTHERHNLTSLAEQVAERLRVLEEGRARWGSDPAARRRALETRRERLTQDHAATVQRRRQAEDAAHRLARTLAELEQLDAEEAALAAEPAPTEPLPALREACARLERAVQQLDGQIAEVTAEQRAHTRQGRVLAERDPLDLLTEDPALRERRAAVEATVRRLDDQAAEVAAEHRAVTTRRRALARRAPADLLAEDPALQARRAEREAALRAIDDRLAATAAERNALADSTDFLTAPPPGAAAESVCPVCRQPLPEALRQRILAENAARDEELAAREIALRDQRAALVAEGDEEARQLKQRLLAEADARLADLEARAKALAAERAEVLEALAVEARQLKDRLLAEHAQQGRALQDRLARLRAERQVQAAALAEAEQREAAARDRRRRLDELAARRQTLLPGDATPAVLHAEHERRTTEATAAREQEEALARDLAAAQQELAALAGFLEIAAMAERSPAALAAARAALARRELLAELFAAATTATLSRLRDGALAEAYAEVARAWETFVGWAGVRLEPQARGRLTVHRAERSLDLAQLSGGERAAFLALLHAHLGRHFGRGGFLLLDEPLEHLDAANGRRLLEHLLRACADGLLQQVVLATVESDVVAATIREGEAHVVPLCGRAR